MSPVLQCLVIAMLAGDAQPPASDEAPLQPLPEAQRDAALAEAAWERGVQAYGAGRLDDAVKAFEEAYRYSGSPGPVFNLGQAYRHAYEESADPRDRHLAILSFQKYLELDPNGKRAVEAERHLAELLPLSSLELMGMELPTRVNVSTTVVDARISIDEGPFQVTPIAVDVEPGAHTIVVEADGYHRYVHSVMVPDGSDVTLNAVLTPKDARLRVNAPAGSDLYVDGERLARLPIDAAIPVPPGVHQVGVARAGRSLFIREVELDRGEDHEIDARLELTGQRKISFIALGVGGAGVVATAVLTGLAIAGQKEPLKIQEERTDGSIALERELQRKELVDRRDKLRGAAIGVGIGSAVLITAGVALFATDRPPVGSQLHAPGRRPSKSRRLSAAPSVGRRFTGAHVRWTF